MTVSKAIVRANKVLGVVEMQIEPRTNGKLGSLYYVGISASMGRISLWTDSLPGT